MRVLVYPHDMELGGSSINAVDLAAAVRTHGHDVWVIARPGPLAERVRDKGLPLLEIDVPTRPRPWPGAVKAVHDAARGHGVDLVHTYEFWPCVEAYFATGLSRRTRVVSTIMTMGLASYLPRAIPMTVGYGDLADEARRRQRAPVHLVEPPIDTDQDRPGTDTEGFRQRFGLDAGPLNIVIVSRTAVAMKQEGIERTIDAVGRLAARQDVRLVIVGGGSAYDDLLRRAMSVNLALGRSVVVMTGPLADPRPAYEIADIVVGMGSSVLRGMAFGKAAIVIGERGYSEPVTSASLSRFDRTGFYGVGPGRPGPESDPLVAQIGQRLSERVRREAEGTFNRDLVNRRFSLIATARKLDEIYRLSVEDRRAPSRRVPDLAMTASRVLLHKARDRGVLGRPHRLACS